MPETVIFLGAGASRDLALPLSNELLPQIFERLRSGTLFQGDTDATRAVEACLRCICPGAYQARDDGQAPEVIVVQMGAADRPRYNVMFPTFTYHGDGFLSYLSAQSSSA